MHSEIKQLNSIYSKINEIFVKKQLKKKVPTIIAVSKTFPKEVILPFIDSGHIHFGENKIQEAEKKWLGLKTQYQNIKLHMIGKIQSNKAKKAIEIFDFIHSLDNIKLAEKLSRFQLQLNKKVKIFIQVNIGDESQKNGVSLKDLKIFYNYCIKDLSLNIIGLMCIPPNDSESEKYFKKLKDLSIDLNLHDLSMGMSNDYLKAVEHGATYLRIGSLIFGNRKPTQ